MLRSVLRRELNLRFVHLGMERTDFLGAALQSPALTDLLPACRMYMLPAEWKAAKLFRLADWVLPMAPDQRPASICARLAGVFQTGRAPM